MGVQSAGRRSRAFSDTWRIAEQLCTVRGGVEHVVPALTGVVDRITQANGLGSWTHNGIDADASENPNKHSHGGAKTNDTDWLATRLCFYILLFDCCDRSVLTVDGSKMGHISHFVKVFLFLIWC